ncbi:MAG: HD-GYP domain-containing protein [Ilumatobacter sp.]|uniref:HD domain-containing phosphohydrolase n=1 Tax=Ilumatobacter sp. TaxID=1967498 RepID=UPI002617AE40|nr:HD-GYP domain-containing protein [Ilumatobacter sp.]MDJ0770954.1 HD-GYP domain-containing protein [Ilumatobacter sp.]
MTSTLAAITALVSLGAVGDGRWVEPNALFVLGVVAAVVGIGAATVVIAVADRREIAEMGLLGTALLAASVMLLVRALVTPDVLFDDTDAFHTAAFLFLPLAIAVAVPLLVTSSGFGRWAARHWRDWTLLAVLGVFIVGSVVAFFPDAIAAPSASSPVTLGASIAMMAAFGFLALRQLRLFELGGQTPNMIAAMSLAALGLTAFLPTIETDFGGAFWWLHLLGAVSLVGTCAGMVLSKGMNRTTHDVLAPVLVRDPFVAFELGLSPVVHRFVADLERKDATTREHVIRTGEMAIRLGERFHLSGARLRNLGLAAMLHDVGKLEIDDEILKKPGRLTTDEYEVMKEHVLHSESMLLAEPTLAAAAPIVRAHHERMDGQGYPDGLRGADIPLDSRIIAVCDAFDAMTHDRPYRTGVSVATALSVLREHTGSQWDADVIDRLVLVLADLPSAPAQRQEPQTAAVAGDEARELVAAIDAEI